jgi:hypothetical protein
MSPYELAKNIHRDLAGVAPRLAAALNRALVDIGEGSRLITLQAATGDDDPATFQETERIDVQGTDAADVIFRLNRVIASLEQHSCWRVIVDKKPAKNPAQMDLMYTIFRDRTRCGL